MTVAYVEGRDEADRGASHQPLTQVTFGECGDLMLVYVEAAESCLF